MPASTSPSRTAVSTARTSAPYVTGVTATFAAARTCWATVPQGTCGWHSATLTPGPARSVTPATRAGLPLRTAICMVLRANVRASAASPPASTDRMVAGLAEANTSAGAPWTMLCASAELAPKLNRTVTPGFAASNRLPSVPNESVSEAAANTVTVPVGPLRDGEPGSVPSSPQPAARASAAAAAATRTGLTVPPRSLRSLRWSLPRRLTVPPRFASGLAPLLGRCAPCDAHSPVASPLEHLDDDVRRLHRGDRDDAGLQPQVVGGLPAHQRHHPERPGLQLHLRHHPVLGDPGDDAPEAVAGGLGHHRLGVGGGPGRGVGRRADDELGQRRPVHRQPGARLPQRGQPAGVGPPAHRVVADAEQGGHLADPVRRHGGHASTASAAECTETSRSCGLSSTGCGEVHEVPRRRPGVRGGVGPTVPAARTVRWCGSRAGEGVGAAEQDTGDAVVGRVAGTEDATPLVFRVAVSPAAYLQLDDVVVTSRE